MYYCLLDAGKTWGYCTHETLFPMSSREIFGSIITGLVVGFANAGGAGGGFLIVPLVFGFFNYNLKESIMVSYIMVFEVLLVTTLDLVLFLMNMVGAHKSIMIWQCKVFLYWLSEPCLENHSKHSLVIP